MVQRCLSILHSDDQAELPPFYKSSPIESNHYSHSQFYKKDARNRIFVTCHIRKALEESGMSFDAENVDLVAFNAENGFAQTTNKRSWGKMIAYLIGNLRFYVDLLRSEEPCTRRSSGATTLSPSPAVSD